MSNYIYNMIVCSKVDFYRLFRYTSYNKGEPIPNISFNKLFDVHSLDDYYDKIGTPISYGWGYNYISRSDDKCILKFLTRNYYPIEAIIKAIELSHDIEWYVVEENQIYVSKFYWNNNVKEAVLYIEKDYSDWYDKYIEFEDALFEENEADCGVWYFLKSRKNKWAEWNSNDNFSRYRDNCAYNVKYPFSKDT